MWASHKTKIGDATIGIEVAENSITAYSFGKVSTRNEVDGNIDGDSCFIPGEKSNIDPDHAVALLEKEYMENTNTGDKGNLVKEDASSVDAGNVHNVVGVAVSDVKAGIKEDAIWVHQQRCLE